MTSEELDKVIKDGIKGVEIVDKKLFNKSIWTLCGKIFAIAKKEPMVGRKLTDAERRELVIEMLDGRAKAGEITPQEMDRYITLCGLDSKTQDILVEIVDFCLVGWENGKSDSGLIETEFKEGEEDD